MATINQALIEWLVRKLEISGSAVYTRINKIVNETGLERDIAALKLGRDNGANLNKFSTPAQRAELRGQASEREDRPDPPSRSETPAKRASARKAVKKSGKGTKVFVVHGRDTALRKSMFSFLRSIDLQPMEWDVAIDEAKEANPYVGDVLKAVMEKAAMIVVLLTPDDLVSLKDQFIGSGERSSEGKAQGQARPNVLFEAGLALGAHADKTLMVQIGKVKPFSDIGGKHMLKLDDSTERRNSLINRLAKHCNVNRIGSDWMTTGTFKPTEPKPAKKRAGKS